MNHLTQIPFGMNSHTPLYIRSVTMETADTLDEAQSAFIVHIDDTNHAPIATIKIDLKDNGNVSVVNHTERV